MVAYLQRERAYVVQYIRTAYPNDRAQFNVRVGAMPDKLQGIDIGTISPNIYKVFNRYVDGVVFLQDRNVLVEAKIPADLGAVSQLEYYAMLFYQTPEFTGLHHLPLELQIVTPLADPTFIDYAQGKNVKVVIFRTPAATEYLTSLLRGKPANG